MVRLLSLVLALAIAAPARAGGPKPGPLTELPHERLEALAPLLAMAELVLVESNDKGQLKQLTTATWAAAPPEKVREVVIDPAHYPDFVRNTKANKVWKEPGGTFVHQFGVSYGLFTVEGRNRYTLLPADGVGAPPVEMNDPDDEGTAHYIWRFLPAAGGTVVVLYGYNKIGGGLMKKIASAAPNLEHGIVLTAQMTLLLSMARRAEALTQAHPAPPTGKPGSFEFMLERGAVALIRRAAGRVADLSLVERTLAQREHVARIAGEPSRWSQFVPTIKRSTPLGSEERVEIEQSLPLVTFTSELGVRATADAADLFALSGDLRGGRLRFDTRPREGGSELILRSTMKYDEGSTIVRQLYKIEPFFEYGIDVALGLVLVDAIKHRAEDQSAERATRKP